MTAKRYTVTAPELARIMVAHRTTITQIYQEEIDRSRAEGRNLDVVDAVTVRRQARRYAALIVEQLAEVPA